MAPSLGSHASLEICCHPRHPLGRASCSIVAFKTLGPIGPWRANLMDPNCSDSDFSGLRLYVKVCKYIVIIYIYSGILCIYRTTHRTNLGGPQRLTQMTSPEEGLSLSVDLHGNTVYRCSRQLKLFGRGLGYPGNPGRLMGILIGYLATPCTG